eukprot:CAMPEP_0168248930 /NCGR_PEP_ID=MMETSP0141_2-20121125/1723_1 /TAXON_ID=44445 /ORGANISM="Pseudo-nitzschia australis, Strain 10249 10 AB" /LENGTH=639 /DNA_ID=CAMNT_0008184875 /DNA_START=39 /DNA_END=1958 /DNA_ORIENTATION=-
MTTEEWYLNPYKHLSFCAFWENGTVTPVILITVFLGFSLVLICILRRRTKFFLERSGLPTVYWRPRFMNYEYQPSINDQKLAPSSVTRILPKMRKHGGPFGMFGTVYGVTTPVIHVAHPIPAKAILSGRISANSKGVSRRPSVSIAHSTATSKAPSYDHFKDFMGKGVFTTDGDDWKAKRTAIMHHLIKGTASSTSELSQRLETEANRAATTFCGQVQALQLDQTGTTYNKRGVVTADVTPLLQRSTIGFIYRYLTNADPEWLLPVNMVCETKCGDDIMGISSENCSLASSTDETVASVSGIDDDIFSLSSPSSSMLNKYLSATVKIRMIILANSRSLWYLLPRWCYRFFSSLYRDEKRTLDVIHEFAKMACEDAQPQSPLARLRESGGPYNSDNSSSASRKSFNKNLMYEATTLLFAGQDTGAATLSWTLHLLSLYSHAQERLAKELREVLDVDENFVGSEERIITKKMILKLPYLDAVIKESMRLYPVAPFVVRRLQEEIYIPMEKKGETMSLPAGSDALIWIYSLHRNPEFWGRPDDFIPERWIDSNLKDPGQSNGSYMPFAVGPRNCLGRPLAHINLRTILAKVIYEYKFTDIRLRTVDNANDLRIEMEAGFTVLPTGGVHLEIENRKSEKKKVI